MMRSLSLLVLVYFTITLKVFLVTGNYVLEVRTLSYENPTNLAAGHVIPLCCDNFQFSDCAGSDFCDNFFQYCIGSDTGFTGSYEAGCGDSHTGYVSEVSMDGALIDFNQPVVLGLPNPLIFEGLDTLQGQNLYIDVLDDDSPIRELVDYFSVSLNDLKAGQGFIVGLRGNYDLGRITVSVLVFCAPNFYGDFCSLTYDRCLANTPMCNVNASFVRVDHCAGVTCHGNGTCISGPDTYTCDYCVNVTCSGNGTCISGPDTYTCDHCAGVTCSGNGTCINGPDTYTCDYCVNVTCSGNGTCISGPDTYTCDYCVSVCETDLDVCEDETCNDRGTCVGTDDPICVCDLGYTGQSCETSTFGCFQFSLDQLCGGHGNCQLFILPTCVCNPGFTGTYCEVELEVTDVTSTEIVTTSSEIVTSSTDIVSDVVTTSPEIASTEIITTSTDVVTTSPEIVTTSTDVVTTSTEIVATSTDVLTTTPEIVTISSDVVTTSPEIVTTSPDVVTKSPARFTEVNIDDCVGVNCSGNGQCVDGVNNFTCVCQSGFTGDLCSVEIQAEGQKSDSSSVGGVVGGTVGALVILLGTVVFLVVMVMVLLARLRSQKRNTNSLESTGADPAISPPAIEPGDNDYGMVKNIIYGLSQHERAPDTPVYDYVDPSTIVGGWGTVEEDIAMTKNTVYGVRTSTCTY